jgi:hypothetical protein
MGATASKFLARCLRFSRRISSRLRPALMRRAFFFLRELVSLKILISVKFAGARRRQRVVCLSGRRNSTEETA